MGEVASWRTHSYVTSSRRRPDSCETYKSPNPQHYNYRLMSYCIHPACNDPHNCDDANSCHNCGSNLLLAQRYRAIKLLGVGGFGRTFLGVDEYKPSQPPCVIKQFFPKQQPAKTEKYRQQFFQEAARLEQLGMHSQIPHLLAYFTQDNYQYLVQEFADGENLARELEDTGAFSEVKIRQLLNEVLPVLQFIHDRQVIHRDIKPENIIRPRSGSQLMLVDFGAAKVTSRSTLPKTGTVIGSAAYTAPEQLLGKAEVASDIYSLGVTCIHLLTHIPPFDLYDSTEGGWVWRDYLRTPISSQLGKVIDKMLQPAIKYRYQTASSILADLKRSRTAKKTGFVPLPPPLPPSPLTGALVFQPQPKSPRVEIEKAVQTLLSQYWVAVKLTWGNDYLTAVMSLEEDTPFNYSYLGQKIVETVAGFGLPELETIKVFGKINGRLFPEWKQHYNLRIKKSLVTRAIVKLSEYKTKKFWLANLKQRRFWLDGLTFCLLSFVFGFRIILLHPLMAMVAAAGFVLVKNCVNRDREFREDNLYLGAIALSLVLGFSNLRLPVTGIFGILLAVVLIASPLFPLFYIKSSSG